MIPFMLLLAALPDLAEEDRLLDRARQGDQKAIAAIYENYVDALYSFIRWRVDDPALAEDLTADVFIKLLSALQSPQAPRQSLRGWLFRVARNVLYDHAHQPVTHDALDDGLAAPDNIEGDLMALLEREQVQQALRTLAPDQQDVLILRFGRALSLQETAASMNRSVSAVKSLQFRAIESLRRALSDRQAPLEAQHGTP